MLVVVCMDTKVGDLEMAELNLHVKDENTCYSLCECELYFHFLGEVFNHTVVIIITCVSYSFQGVTSNNSSLLQIFGRVLVWEGIS